MIEVKEYWPTFVERDEAERQVTVVEDESDICMVPWLAKKLEGRFTKDVKVEWDKHGGFISSFVPKTGPDLKGAWWIVATLKHL